MSWSRTTNYTCWSKKILQNDPFWCLKGDLSLKFLWKGQGFQNLQLLKEMNPCIYNSEEQKKLKKEGSAFVLCHFSFCWRGHCILESHNAAKHSSLLDPVALSQKKRIFWRGNQRVNLSFWCEDLLSLWSCQLKELSNPACLLWQFSWWILWHKAHLWCFHSEILAIWRQQTRK